jgi:hypothetical protein
MGGAGIWFGAGWLEEGLAGPVRALASDEADASPEAPPTPRPAIPRPGERVRVEVLNAGGVRGAASQVTDRLRDSGFDVVYFGNAPTFGESSSRVLLRAGPAIQAEAVARALGIPEVESREDPSLLVEVTVLVGADWPEAWARLQQQGEQPDRDD